MQNLRYIEGFMGYRIVDEQTLPDPVLGQCSDEDLVRTYLLLKEANYHQQDSREGHQKGLAAFRRARSLEPHVISVFRRAGWTALSIPDGGDPIQPHEIRLNPGPWGLDVMYVPFSMEQHISAEMEDFFDSSGKIYSKDETLRRLKQKYGEEEIDLEALREDDELEWDDYVVIKGILATEGLKSLHELDTDLQTLRSGQDSFQWAESEDEVRGRVRAELESSEAWKEAVAADQTVLGEKEWIENTIRVEGWAASIAEDGLRRDIPSYIYDSIMKEDGDKEWAKAISRDVVYWRIG